MSRLSNNSLLIAVFLSLVVFFSPSFAALGDVEKVPADPDVGKEMAEIIQTRGFPVETHYVTTTDGYILTVFRIPHNNKGQYSNGNSAKAALGQPVLLQHGLLDSSYTWVNNYEDQSLGYILSNAGFDVWFGNNRGNRYGRNHTTMNPDDKTNTFWQFSWDEMAQYDIPAMINYITSATRHKTLGYVGHSEGTIQMFAAGSSLKYQEGAQLTDKMIQQQVELKDALSKVNLFVALAPVTYVSNLKSKLFIALAHTDLVYRFINKQVYEFLPYGPVDAVASEVCQAINVGCDIFLMALCGPSRHINSTRIQVYVSETPAGTSTYNMWHWMQGVLTPTFQKLDWENADINMQHYGQTVPPTYDLSTYSIPTAIFNGDHDYLADVDDVNKMLSEIPSTSIVYHDEAKDYAHLDYTWAYDANVRIYGKVTHLLEKYATPL